MRLIHTSSKFGQPQGVRFEEFFDSAIPEYVILSHRWGEGEVTFKDLRKARAQHGPGLTKIQRFCELAAEAGFEWAWMDTCCIDKRSSAELSEAINSMFAWYKDAEQCWVYLADVFGDSMERDERFQESDWFTRGWTLQELLANRDCRFYDREWRGFGTRQDMWHVVSSVTGIEGKFLQRDSIYRQPLEDISVAAKMSWASKRKTSRGEDMSYSLLGLFNVNMPLLYGEGEAKAFERLQLEIIKSSSDQSLFAWAWRGEDELRFSRPNLTRFIRTHGNGPATGVLAPSVRSFVDSGNIEPYRVCPNEPILPYDMTNTGLHMQAMRSRLISSQPPRGGHDQDVYTSGHELTLVLNCCKNPPWNSPRHQGIDFVSISLLKTEIGWIRMDEETLSFCRDVPQPDYAKTLEENAFRGKRLNSYIADEMYQYWVSSQRHDKQIPDDVPIMTLYLYKGSYTGISMGIS